MAEFIVWGTEEELCRDPDGVGCDHAIALHSENSDGCSHIGVSGWCGCTWCPERTGAAKLLEQTVSSKWITTSG